MDAPALTRGFRACIILLAVFLSGRATNCAGGDEAAPAPAPAAPGLSQRGPQVEITPLDGKAPLICALLGFQSGTLQVLIDSGQTVQVKAEDVKSIRFLPPPAASAPSDSSARDRARRDKGGKAAGRTDDKADDKRLAIQEFQRLRQLAEKDGAGPLTPAEEDELRKLRERAPLFAIEGPFGRLRRNEVADRTARHEQSKGRLPQHIAMLQAKLKNAQSEEDARDALSMLSSAYRLKGPTPGNPIPERLQKDAESVENAAVRAKAQQALNEILESMRPKPGGK